MKYNIFPFNLTNALDTFLDITAGFVYVKEATDSAVTIDIRYDSKSNDKINLAKSFGVIGKFNRLYLSANAQAGKTVQIFISDSYESLRIFEQAATPDINTLATITNPVKVEPARVLVNTARIAVGVAETALLASATTRKRASIKASPGNIGYITIGTTGITLTTGYILFPGESVTLEYSGILKGIAETANDLLYILEEKEI